VATLVTAATSNTGTVDYVGETEVTAASTADTASSSIFGGNDNVQLRNGATGWLQLVGREIDISAQTGSSVQDIIGEQMVLPNGSTVVGTRSNIAYTINSGQSNATGWDCGFCFGNYAGAWPMNATATMVGCWPTTVARNGAGSAVPTSAGCGTTLFGVDLSNITFAAGGSPFVAPLITPASSAAA